MGGFVAWHMGERDDGADSVAKQVVDETHWPEMEVLVLVVNAGKKAVSSTAGMQETIKTSPFIKVGGSGGVRGVEGESNQKAAPHHAVIPHIDMAQTRAETVVPERMAQITEAIRNRDFETFAKITMMDSNQFHATCLDTYPPIFYMNDVSRAIVQVLTRFNDLAGIKVGVLS